MALTDKQRMFVEEYLTDFNAQRAFLAAGYSEKHAHVNAYKLLGSKHVQALLNEKMGERVQKLEVKSEDVLQEIARLAFSDFRNYAEWDNKSLRLKDSAELTEDQSRAILEVKDGQYGMSLKLADKTKALELLGKHLKLFTEKSEITGADGGAIRTLFFTTSGIDPEETDIEGAS